MCVLRVVKKKVVWHFFPWKWHNSATISIYSYACNEMKCSENQCEYGYECVKENDYLDCDTSYKGAYCAGICIQENEY